MRNSIHIILFIVFCASQMMIDASIASEKSLTEEIRQNFKNPPADCWPHTRWWWPGNPVSKETITWHLEQMNSHGIKGVEQITMGNYYQKDNIPFMSEEFLEMLTHMVKEAKRLGMEVSINYGGPGWIIGGAWVPEDERSKDIVPTSVILKGPKKFSGKLPDKLTRTKRSWERYKPELEGKEKLLAVVAGKIENNIIDESSLTILTDRVNNGILDWKVPEGEWRVMAFWLMRNDHDHAVDHFSTKAMRNYCNYFGGALQDAFGDEFGATVESMFIDSFELSNSASGIYWSDDLLEKYKKYKGYDLTPYLPAIWWEVGEISAKIRYDVNEFLHHMGLEVFYKEFVGWCEANGLKSRIQTYGFTTDNLEAAGSTHIPEMEITAGEKDAMDWFDTRIGPKKYVASGAHIYGKDIISAEVYTFIHWERYRATLEELKIASDNYLRAGTTKFYNHGYSFTPEKDLAPSRAVGFAANISPTNIWWDYYPNLAEYIARSSYLLRQGDFNPDIAVYSPLANQWTIDVLNARKWTREFDWGGLGELLLSNGYDYDLLNDDALQNIARVKNGKIVIRNMEYKVLLLPAIKSLPLKTLQFIYEYVNQGGVVIALDRIPENSTGFADYKKNDSEVRKAVKDLFEEPFGRDKVGTINLGEGHSHFIKMVLERKIWWDIRSSTLDPFINTIKKYIQPDFGIDFAYEGLRRNKGLTFVHRKLKNADIYFVTNIQDKPSIIPVTFRVKDKKVCRWDPYTGEISKVHHYLETDTGIRIPLQLAAYESTFLIFEPGNESHVSKTNFQDIIDMNDKGLIAEAFGNGIYQTTIISDQSSVSNSTNVSDIPAPYEINGNWQLSLKGNDFTGLDTSFTNLYSWTDIPHSKHCSGTGRYTLTFDLPESYFVDDMKLRLDLGKIGDIAEVKINSKDVGIIWMRGQLLDISQAVKSGKNNLEILVTNTSINRVSGFKNIKPVPAELVDRYGEANTQSKPREFGFEPLPPSGLMGPVQIIPSRVVKINIQ